MNFPKELAVLPQWICWRLEPDSKSEKPRKVPYDPKTGRKASSTNPQTWATLAEAEAACDGAGPPDATGYVRGASFYGEE